MENTKNITRDFLLAGRAEFTVSNPKGEHYTVKVAQPKNSDARGQKPYFVSIKDSSHPRAKWGYCYAGILNTHNNTVARTFKSVYDVNDLKFKVAAWAIKTVLENLPLPDGYSIKHVGKCGKCGKKLTDPESIDRGLGPVCVGSSVVLKTGNAPGAPHTKTVEY